MVFPENFENNQIAAALKLTRKVITEWQKGAIEMKVADPGCNFKCGNVCRLLQKYCHTGSKRADCPGTGLYVVTPMLEE
jgi:hypothetical protein